jgi:hypothetical protein
MLICAGNQPPEELVQQALSLLDATATDPPCRAEVDRVGWGSPGHMNVCGDAILRARETCLQSQWTRFNEQFIMATSAERRRGLAAWGFVSGVAKWLRIYASSLTDEDITRGLAICLATAAPEYASSWAS